MTKIWILILALSGHTLDSGVALDHVPAFETQTQCESAGRSAKEKFDGFGFGKLRWTCVEGVAR